MIATKTPLLWLDTGELVFPPRLSESDKERFRAKFDVAIGGCWLWNAEYLNKGYGVFSIGQKRISAHRLMFMLYNGSIKRTLMVRHTCNVRNCVNPDHLVSGTNGDNYQDSVKAGTNRAPKGIEHGNAKLTDAQVREIRRRYTAGEYETQKLLGAEFDVDASTVRGIVSNKQWRHLL
jgi:hypothetical protein